MIINWIKTSDLKAALPDLFWDDPATYIAKHAKSIKDSGFHRDVLILNPKASGQKVLVKHFSQKSLFEKLKWIASLDPAHKEWSIMKALTEKNCPIPKPLAFGSKTINGIIHVWLLMEFIEDIITFDQHLPPTNIRAVKVAAKSLAKAIAQIHLAGVFHGDMHSGNLLFRPELNNWLITDFQQSRLGNTGKGDMIQDLIQLQHCLGKKVPLAVRLLFLRTYLDTIAKITQTEDLIDGDEWKTLFFDIRAKAFVYSIVQAHKRAKRAMHSNRNFAKLDQWISPKSLPKHVEQGWIARNTSRQVANDIIDLIADKTWFLDTNVQVVKNSASACVGIYSHPQGKYFIKQYRYKNKFIDKIRAWRHLSKAHIAWVSSYRLQLLHLKTPKSVLVLWQPQGGFLVQEYIDKLTTADLALQALSDNPRQRRKLIYKLAKEVSFMHNRAVAHGDLKGSNLAVAHPKNHKVTVYLIDIHPVKFHQYLPWSARIKDLARLFAALYPYTSSTEQRYFLHIYLKFQALPLDLHQLIFEVRMHAENKLMKKHGIQL